jgi:hypothetical protein
MSYTKELFGILITTVTNWWGPTTIRISGDPSVAGQIHKKEDGLVEFSFPDRMVMIANHQVRRPIRCFQIVERLICSADLHRLALPLVDRLCQ